MSPQTLPLLYYTPKSWASAVLQDPCSLLSDQAYLEKKAANNALEFLNLWSQSAPPPRWLSSIAAVAKDETLHLQAVLKLLEKRHGKLARTHKNPYASDLGKLVRRGKGKQELVDRLLVSSLIEARSCERFERLQEASEDAELSRFYGSLMSSENGHYRIFLELARQVLRPPEVENRWREFLAREAEIIQNQAPGPRIHGGFAV